MLLIALALGGAVPTNTIVKVEGHAFRVHVRGDAVKVTQKAVLTRVSLEARANMRAAVKAATGCSITDDYWSGTAIEGQLNCRPSSP